MTNQEKHNFKSGVMDSINPYMDQVIGYNGQKNIIEFFKASKDRYYVAGYVIGQKIVSGIYTREIIGKYNKENGREVFQRIRIEILNSNWLEDLISTHILMFDDLIKDNRIKQLFENDAESGPGAKWVDKYISKRNKRRIRRKKESTSFIAMQENSDRNLYWMKNYIKTHNEKNTFCAVNI